MNRRFRRVGLVAYDDAVGLLHALTMLALAGTLNWPGARPTA